MKRNLKWAAAVVGAAGVIGAAFVGGRAWAGGIPAAGALTYSGLLQDASGAPLTGTQYVELKFWNDTTASLPANLLCDTGTPTGIGLVNGRFSITLPDKCTTQVGSNAAIWAEVIVGPTANGAASLGRAKIGAVPFAVEANHASSADKSAGAFAVASDLTVGGAVSVTGKVSVGVHGSTTCTYMGGNAGYTDCTCPAGETAISGGGYNTANGLGTVYLVESRNLFPAFGSWRIGCADQAGNRVACVGVFALCARLQ